MPRPHQDPAITAYVRHVTIGLENGHPEILGRRYGMSGAWAANVRDGHRGVGLQALQNIANQDFGGSLDRLEAAARQWAAAHPDLVPPPKKPRKRARSAGAKPETGTLASKKNPGASKGRSGRASAGKGASGKGASGKAASGKDRPPKDGSGRGRSGKVGSGKGRPKMDDGAAKQPSPRDEGHGETRQSGIRGGRQLENLRAARERLLDRGYPRHAVNEALLSPTVQDTTDVLLVFDLAERHLIAHGYEAQLQKLLRQGRPRKRPDEQRTAEERTDDRGGVPSASPEAPSTQPSGAAPTSATTPISAATQASSPKTKRAKKSSGPDSPRRRGRTSGRKTPSPKTSVS